MAMNPPHIPELDDLQQKLDELEQMLERQIPANIRSKPGILAKFEEVQHALDAFTALLSPAPQAGHGQAHTPHAQGHAPAAGHAPDPHGGHAPDPHAAGHTPDPHAVQQHNDPTINVGPFRIRIPKSPFQD